MSMLSRANIMRATRFGGQIQQPQQAEAPKKTVGLDALDKMSNAGSIEKTLPFRVNCGIKNGVVIFFAQLAGGQSFGVTPVMPKDPYGNPLTPDNVVNGAEGILTLRISENAKLELSESGRMEFTVRPSFVRFEEPPAAEETPKAEAKTSDKK